MLRAGYEYTHPELAQYQQLLQSKGREVLKFFEHNPDFILFKKDKSSLYLVEVKYRHELDPERVREIAEEEVKQSGHIWLFLATPNGFFFSQCKDIVRTGIIQPLSPEWVSPELQRAYLGLLKEFIRFVSVRFDFAFWASRGREALPHFPCGKCLASFRDDRVLPTKMIFERTATPSEATSFYCWTQLSGRCARHRPGTANRPTA